MGIAGRRNQSCEGLLWLLLQEIDYPDLQHALSTCGEKVLFENPVDGLHEATNTVFQFHSCFWHGCPKCYVDFFVAYSISIVAYYPARVSNVLGSEHIYGGGLPLPSPTNSLCLGPGRI